MLQPTRGKILVQNISDEKILPSGIILAETIKEVPHRGKVIAIGLPKINDKGVELPWEFNIGDIVHYKRQWTQPASNYILLRDDVYAYESYEKLYAPSDFVIVERVYTKKIGNSSIIIPETFGVKENYEEFYGLVYAVGSDNKYGLSIGDKILYHRNEGLYVRFNDKEYFSLKHRAIFAMAEV